jgi:hypothetical protein
MISQQVMADGTRVDYNFIRPNMGLDVKTPAQIAGLDLGLDGKTPAEVAGIEVEGANKWLTIIQNASRREPN